MKNACRIFYRPPISTNEFFQRCNQAAPLVATMQPEPRERRGSAVTAIERRAEIMRILTARRSSNIRTLAAEMGVCRRTICTDIEILTADYPLETSRGKGGCVKVAQWYHPHRNILSGEQQRVLAEIMQTASEQQAQVLREMLLEYGSPKTRQTLQEGFNVQ